MNMQWEEIKLHKVHLGCVEEVVWFIPNDIKNKSCSIRSGHKCTLSVICCGCESPWLRRGGSHSVMRFVNAFQTVGELTPKVRSPRYAPVSSEAPPSPARVGS